MARKLIVEIVGDSRDLEKAFKKSDDGASKLSSSLKSLGKTGVLAGGALGVGAVAVTLKAGISEYIETAKVAAQTRAVLKSTGGVANVTAKQVDKLSGALLHQSGVDDELIKSGANVLLTFTKIRNQVGKGNDVFDQATQATLDLSVATGKSMPAAARIVGRALQDPIKGIGALRRVGVQLTDAQEKSIKTFVAQGREIKAQKIILGELDEKVGGSAKALGQTLPGQINIVRESFNNWAGQLVAKMIPVLERLVAWVREHWPEMRKAILDAWVAIKPTLVALGDLVGSIVQLFITHWPKIKPIVLGVVRIIKAQLAVITPALQLLADLLRGDWSKAWGHFKEVIVNAMKAVRTIIKTEVKLMLNVLRGFGTALIKLIVAPINAIIDKINGIKVFGFDPIPHIPRIPVPGAGGGGGAAQGLTGPVGAATVVHTTINLDGKKVSESTTKHQNRAQKRTAPQRTGRYAGTSFLVQG